METTSTGGTRHSAASGARNTSTTSSELHDVQPPRRLKSTKSPSSDVES